MNVYQVFRFISDTLTSITPHPKLFNSVVHFVDSIKQITDMFSELQESEPVARDHIHSLAILTKCVQTASEQNNLRSALLFYYRRSNGAGNNTKVVQPRSS